MSEQQMEQVWVGFRAGESLSRIGRREGVPKQQVARYLQSYGGVRPLPAPHVVRQVCDLRVATFQERSSPALLLEQPTVCAF